MQFYKYIKVELLKTLSAEYKTLILDSPILNYLKAGLLRPGDHIWEFF